MLALATDVDDDQHARELALSNVEDYSINFEHPVGTGATATILHARRRKGAHDLDDHNSDMIPTEVVFKVFTPPETQEAFERQAALLETEVAILTKMQYHPNIVVFYGICDIPCEDLDVLQRAIQMEYCSGGDLVTAVSKHRFPEVRAREVISGILKGLAHMHKCGFVHRDVKPENVLLTNDGEVRLADFGITASVTDHMAMRKRCGSPGYVAPEVWLGKTYGIKVDSFSAGAVLYFIISGKMAFRGNCLQSVMQKTINNSVNFRKSMCLERLSEGCKAFIAALLEKQPDGRPTAFDALNTMWNLPPAVQSVTALSPDLVAHQTSNKQLQSEERMTDASTTCRGSSRGEPEWTSHRDSTDCSMERSSRRSASSSKSSNAGQYTDHNLAGSEWNDLAILCERTLVKPQNSKPIATESSVMALRRKRYQIAE